MKILFDYQAFTQCVGGVSRYHTELIKNFSDDVEVVLPTLFSKNIYLSEINARCHTALFNKQFMMEDNIFKILNIARSIYILRNAKYDVFHPTFLNPYFINHVKKPVVSTMHDLTHEKYPKLLPKASTVIEKRKRIIRASDIIIAISEETKRDLMTFYNIPDEKIVVIYHGIDQTLINSSGKKIIYIPYILYIGSRNSYKNFPMFLKAFSLIDQDVHLICTGTSFNSMELSLILQLGLEDRVHQMFVSNEELNNLLCNAVAFIYPSMSEGFGLPILEAFRCGCPCIISNLMCFKEVAGNAAIYFDPNSVEDMKVAISKTISDSSLLSCLKEEGYSRMKTFTWKKTAAKTECVYRKIL